MKKADFFKEAISSSSGESLDWVFGAFSISLYDEDGDNALGPYEIRYFRENPESIFPTSVVFADQLGNEVEIDDYAYDPSNPKPPYEVTEILEINKGDLPNITKKMESTYGRYLANWLLCVYPFHDKVEYINRRFGVGEIEKIIEKKLTSNSEGRGALPPQSISIDEYHKFQKACSLIDGLTQMCVPSATEKSMSAHPDAEKVRDRLLDENKDRLHDPAVIAMIEDQLKELDREWLKGDRSMGFYIKPKSINVVRKKSHYMMGSETSFAESTEGTVIPTSLREGWDMSKFPAMANNLREGSFDRGAQTALGGAATKEILRTMQNTQIEEEDCGAVLGVDVTIKKENSGEFIGNYHIKNGKSIEITEENVGELVDKPITMRSPLFCKTGRAAFCATCIGKKYAAHETGLATAAANITNIFMGIFMSSMHGKELSVQEWDIDETLS